MEADYKADYEAASIARLVVLRSLLVHGFLGSDSALGHKGKLVPCGETGFTLIS
jgi:hypothetical protein